MRHTRHASTPAIAALRILGTLSACVLLISAASAATPAKPEKNQAHVAAPPGATEPAQKPADKPKEPAAATPEMTMPVFLDRLRSAESGGRDDARNPRSTAVGPYQFIESTWLDLAHRLFATEIATLTPVQILALRADHAFARRAAEAYTKDNAAILKSAGLEPTFPRLRLAHLLGPQGAVRMLQAPAQTPATAMLGSAAASANPFLVGMTAEQLIARAARDLSVDPATRAAVTAGDIPALRAPGKPRVPGLLVRCNLDRPACRHWKALALMRVPTAKPLGKQLALAKTK